MRHKWHEKQQTKTKSIQTNKSIHSQTNFLGAILVWLHGLTRKIKNIPTLVNRTSLLSKLHTNFCFCDIFNITFPLYVCKAGVLVLSALNAGFDAFIPVVKLSRTHIALQAKSCGNKFNIRAGQARNNVDHYHILSFWLSIIIHTDYINLQGIIYIRRERERDRDWERAYI